MAPTDRRRTRPVRRSLGQQVAGGSEGEPTERSQCWAMLSGACFVTLLTSTRRAHELDAVDPSTWSTLRSSSGARSSERGAPTSSRRAPTRRSRGCGRRVRVRCSTIRSSAAGAAGRGSDTEDCDDRDRGEPPYDLEVRLWGSCRHGLPFLLLIARAAHDARWEYGRLGPRDCRDSAHPSRSTATRCWPSSWPRRRRRRKASGVAHRARRRDVSRPARQPPRSRTLSRDAKPGHGRNASAAR